jgi:hypothetical protein
MQYKTGSISIASNSTTVTLAGGSFLGNVQTGDLLLVGPDQPVLVIAAVVDAFTLSLASPWTGPALSFVDYAVVRDFDAETRAPLWFEGDVWPNLMFNFAVDVLGRQTGAGVAAGSAVTEARAARDQAEIYADDAAAAAAAAATSASAAAADRSAVATDRTAVNAAIAAAATSRDAAAASANTAATWATQTSADRAASSSDRTATSLDRTAVEAARIAAGTSASQAADKAAQTTADRAAVAADRTAVAADLTAAETARTGAETARTGAETARTGAETARTGAEQARDVAVNVISGNFAPKLSPNLTGTPTAPTAAAGTATTQIATTAFVSTAVGSAVNASAAALVDGAPTSLNTLNKLAAALGNDPAFAATTAAALATKAPLASPALTGVPTAPTADAGTISTQIATTAFVDANVSTRISALVDAAPGTLDTLKELAAALGDDPNFATTITNALATKAPLASPTLTGVPTAPTADAGTATTQLATTAFVGGAVSSSATDLVGGAPADLNTLNKLAAALGNDPAFAATNAAALATKAPLASPALTGVPTAPTADAGTATTQLATTAFVGSAVSSSATDLVGGAPSDLNTLNKLAAALGNDAAFSATNAAALATKAPLASPALTGAVTISGTAPSLTLSSSIGKWRWTAGTDLLLQRNTAAGGDFSTSTQPLTLDSTDNAQFIGTVTASALVSTVATGTAPLTVTSTTRVTNLNADLLDGLDSTAFAQLAATNVAFTGTGGLTLPAGSTAQQQGGEGTIRYNSETKKPEFKDDTGWKDVGFGVGALRVPFTKRSGLTSNVPLLINYLVPFTKANGTASNFPVLAS